MIEVFDFTGDVEFKTWTPEEILESQWNDFKAEAKALAAMLKQRDNSSALQSELKALWATKGGDTASYEHHQQDLNRLITEAWKLPELLVEEL